MVPGPHTSWVMRTSTSTQTFSSGATDARPGGLARIFSVIVMPAGITNSCAGKGGTERSEYSGESAGILTDAAMRRSMQLISLLKSQIGPKPSRQRSSIDLVDRDRQRFGVCDHHLIAHFHVFEVLRIANFDSLQVS